ncbi:organic cation transporter-like protein isoform X3 [Esox lucius]|uniref:organic cation transporter-like protein isoform X3 n=1 Tax=Esox lucius TaxID=8010 RepID=UPI001476CAFF|nr:organic cation transporter-like protein isoform X3 [Esox lucius]
MAPLQLAVYWRLALIFIFTAFIFLVDVFTVSRTSYLCTNFSRELGAEKRSRGEVPSDASTQNHSTSEEHEGNGSLQLVSIHTQDEITWWNDTKRENGTECLDPEVLSYGQTLFMTGLLVGSLFGGAVSDRYGKRVLLLVCVCVNPVTSALPAVLHHAVFFLALRCLAGVSCCCINICSFSLGVEWSLPKHRMWPPALLSFSFSLGMIVMAPLVYLTHTWVQLHLALAIPQIVCLPAFFYIPESPSWLLVKRRTDTLEKYSRHSPEDKRFLDLLLDTRTEQDVPLDTLTPDSDTHTTDSNTHIPEKYTHTPDKETHTPKTATPSQEEHTLSDLGHMRSPTILLRLAIMGYIGQKCVGLVCLCYRLGCILNAVISPSGETIPVASMIIFGSGPIIGAGLCLLLPETSGVPLPDSLADCDRQPRLSLSTLPHVWSSCLRRRSANAQAAKACPFLTDPEASHNPQELNSADASHTHIH